MYAVRNDLGLGQTGLNYVLCMVCRLYFNQWHSLNNRWSHTSVHIYPCNMRCFINIEARDRIKYVYILQGYSHRSTVVECTRRSLLDSKRFFIYYVCKFERFKFSFKFGNCKLKILSTPKQPVQVNNLSDGFHFCYLRCIF